MSTFTQRSSVCAARPGVAGLRGYRRSAAPAWVTMRLDSNEGRSPPPEAMAALAGVDQEATRRYPDATGLERLIAERLGVAAGQVVATCGGDDAIDRVCRAFIGAGSEAIVATPTFEMIERSIRLGGGRVVGVPWEGEYPIDEVLARVSEATALIAVVSPNNPTGAVVDAEVLRRLSAAAPRAVLLVDLAYSEFADEDLTAAALELPNAVVVRTFSKAWGLAGLRIGYAVSREETAESIRAVGGPFAVSGAGIAAAGACLSGGDAWMREGVAQVRREREQLAAMLEELGLRVAPSQGNFVLARSDRAGMVRERLLSMGISVRGFERGGPLSDAVRITCPGDQEEFDLLATALRSALRPQALLLDMDGVIADVSESYRAAIVATAARFGVDITAEDVAGAKRRPGSNNDWVVTQRLMHERGVTRSLEEVTQCFEGIYAELRDRERMIPERGVLERLAGRIRIGIVTGRPRRDAEEFVSRHRLDGMFSAMVCMEDTIRLKPDPAPVRLAMERMGAGSAWMVGDTPDDVQAARSAGVLPLVVAAPGEDPMVARAVFESVGAAMVLGGLDEIEEMLG